MTIYFNAMMRRILPYFSERHGITHRRSPPTFWLC